MYRSASGCKLHVSTSSGQAYFKEIACGKLLLQGTGHLLVFGNAGLGQYPEVLRGGKYWICRFKHSKSSQMILVFMCYWILILVGRNSYILNLIEAIQLWAKFISMNWLFSLLRNKGKIRIGFCYTNSLDWNWRIVALFGYHLAVVLWPSNKNSFLGHFRRFQALYVSENLVPSGGEIDELVGHTYLYLKEQLEHPAMPPSSILHGTIIGEVFCSNFPNNEVTF